MEKTYLAQFAIVALAHLLAVMSPGPDFAVVTRNSLVSSRSSGVYTALGLSFGILVHVTYSLVGIGYLISASVVAFTTVKLLGAAYLVYLGIKALRSKPAASACVERRERKALGRAESVRIGFLTNLLNPKATLFFLGLFTQVVKPGTPIMVQVLYGLEMMVATFGWFALVAVVFSKPAVKERFTKVAHHVDRAFGAILVALGLKVAFSSR